MPCLSKENEEGDNINKIKLLLRLFKKLKLPPRFFGFGDMGEREIVGGETRERERERERGILISKFFLW